MALVGGDIMRITVFTPTYNRAYIIDELYNSLKKQTFIDFEWLIIDDGSTDCTYEKVKNWSADNTKFLFVIINLKIAESKKKSIERWI